MLKRMLCGAVALFLVAPALQAQSSSRPLDVDDVVVLLGIKDVDPEIRLQLVQQRCISFRVDEAAVVRMKGAGADDAFVAAMRGTCYVAPAVAAPASAPSAPASAAAGADVSPQQVGAAEKSKAAAFLEVEMELRKSLLEEQRAGRISASTAAKSNKVLSAVGSIAGKMEEARLEQEVQAQLRALQQERRRSMRPLVEAQAAARTARLESGVADVVGFQRPLRPAPGETVVESVGARLVMYAFYQMELEPIDWSDKPKNVKGDTENIRMDTVARFQDRTGPGSAPVIGVLLASPSKVYFTTYFELDHPPAAKTPVVISCTHYGPGGEVLAVTNGKLNFEHDKKGYFWHSIVTSRSGWIPGAVYGAQCAADGKPLVNGTYDTTAQVPLPPTIDCKYCKAPAYAHLPEKR